MNKQGLISREDIIGLIDIKINIFEKMYSVAGELLGQKNSDWVYLNNARSEIAIKIDMLNEIKRDIISLS